MVDGAKFCEAFIADLVPQGFADLTIPLTLIAADLHTREALTFTAGPLRPAVAASMAVPGLVRPIEHDGRVLIDGGVVDPLPFTALRHTADVIVAVDVSGGAAEAQSIPDPWETLFAAITVMAHTIVTEKLKSGAPDLLVRPNVGIFRTLDFFQASAILRAAEPVKAEVKEKLGKLLAE